MISEMDQKTLQWKLVMLSKMQQQHNSMLQLLVQMMECVETEKICECFTQEERALARKDRVGIRDLLQRSCDRVSNRAKAVLVLMDQCVPSVYIEINDLVLADQAIQETGTLDIEKTLGSAKYEKNS